MLNRAEIVLDDYISDFERWAADFVDGLLGSIPWVRVTPKLLALCCHAGDFLWRFRSLGRYGDQGLKALHGRINRDAALYPSATLLGSCRQFVQLSAIVGSPTDNAFNKGARRRPAVPGARLATRPDDKRTRASRACAGLAPVSDVCQETASSEMGKWAANVTVSAAARIRAFYKRLEQGTAPALAAIVAIGSPGIEDDRLLAEAESQPLMALLGWS